MRERIRTPFGMMRKVTQQEIVSLAGAYGEGKSTTIQVIAGAEIRDPAERLLQYEKVPQTSLDLAAGNDAQRFADRRPG